MKNETNIYLPLKYLIPTLLAGAFIGCLIADYLIN